MNGEGKDTRGKDTRGDEEPRDATTGDGEAPTGVIPVANPMAAARQPGDAEQAEAADTGRDRRATTFTLPRNGPAEEYLAGVRTALSDLPAPEVAEILDDVRAHLSDLTEELGPDTGPATLTSHLGTPAAYAAELRAAAGYPPAPTPEVAGRHGPGPAVARLAVIALVVSTLLLTFGALGREPGVVLLAVLAALFALPLVVRDGPRVPSVAALPEVRRFVALLPEPGSPPRVITDFVASLQPGWWLVRALAAAALAASAFFRAELGPVVLLALFAVPASIWLGHRTRRDRRWLWAVVPLNGLALALALAGLVGGGSSMLGSTRAVSYPASYQPGLWQDGEQVRDIRPVDAAGNPLTGIYLFDQDGHPLDTADGYGAGCGGGYQDTTADATRPYPRGTVDYQLGTGACVVTPPGPLLVAVPSPTTAPAPTTAAAPTTAPPPATAPSPEPGGPAPEPTPAPATG